MAEPAPTTTEAPAPVEAVAEPVTVEIAPPPALKRFSGVRRMSRHTCCGVTRLRPSTRARAAADAPLRRAAQAWWKSAIVGGAWRAAMRRVRRARRA